MELIIPLVSLITFHNYVVVVESVSSSNDAACTYVNCDPIEQFLAQPAPHVISPRCASCNECAELKFTTCTLVHTKRGESGSHCVCGNTLPFACHNDHIRLIDILERDANTFMHDYACSFSSPDPSEVLPKPTVLLPDSDGHPAMEIPIVPLSSTRRFKDLYVRAISLYLFNVSSYDAETGTTNQVVDNEYPQLTSLDPYARMYLGNDGTPVSVHPDPTRINDTLWPKVVFPQLDHVPTWMAYSLEHPARRLIVDQDDNTSVRAVPFQYSAYGSSSLSPTTVSPGASGHVSNYMLIVLIILGILLFLFLCCALVSCMDKLRRNKQSKTIKNEVATSSYEYSSEKGKSGLVGSGGGGGHLKSYTPIKNGGHDNSTAGPESARLLTTSETGLVEDSTLPMSSSTNAAGRRPGPSDRTPSFPPGTPGIAAAAASSSLGRQPLRGSTTPSGRPPSGSITDMDAKPRNPSAVEADRRKFLDLVKDAIIIKAGDLDLLESIGSGEFGIIRRGYVFDRNEAMIHCLRPPHKQSSDSAAESLIERLDASVKAGFHPHIISLLGLCQEGDILYVALQLETGPNLRNMLRESRSLDQFLQYTNARGRLSLISPQRLLNIILGIARGMGHLEECQVLHDNLAAVNIVICDNGTPKIAGFGMATVSDLYMRQMEKNHDQLRWLPPETHDTGLFTMKSQTWSFGVVLWEIVTFGGTPYCSMSDDDVIRRVAGGYRLHQPSNCSRQLYDLMEQCWKRNGDDRPDFINVQQHVRELNLDPELHVSVVYHDGFSYEPIKETWNT